MGWNTTFHVGHVVVELRSSTELCKNELKAIISLYEPVTSPEPDLLFVFEQQQQHFTLSVNGEDLWESTDSRDFPPALEIHLYRQLICRLTPELISLHASSVVLGNSACIFAGISGAGKSSLCTVALLDGMAYLTDEFVLVDRNGFVHPFPRPLQWDSIDHPAFDSAEMLASGLFGKSSFSFTDPENNIITSQLWLPTRLQHAPIKLGTIILPEYSSDAPKANLKPIRRGEALMRLPEHLHHLMSPAENLKELNRRIPTDTCFYSLRFSNVFAAWQIVKETIFS